MSVVVARCREIEALPYRALTKKENKQMYLPRLRRIADVLNKVRQVDPDTCLTRSMLIELMKQGVITPLKYGNAWVVNMDELLLFVNGKKEK